MLTIFLAPVSALQQQSTLARFFIDSPAVSTDWDFGSGDNGCFVPSWPEPLVFLDQQECSILSTEPLVGGIRYGEADHPDPSSGNLLTVGVNNPSGLRQKEQTLLDLGPGIWSIAETQLSATTFKTSSHILRKEARALNRDIRLHSGSPAPLRTGSQWAGSWTGVAILADVPTSPLDVPWHAEHWNSG